MPNWCNNYIVISGDKEKMKPIYDYFESSQAELDKHYEDKSVILKENLVMNTLVPHDEEYKKIEAGGDYLLNPQTEFYGTKWDFDFSECNTSDISKDTIAFSPLTAWSPPSQFCQKLAVKYGVQVSVQYDEPGVGFVGKEVYYPDGTLDEEFYDNYLEGMYKLQPEDFWECEVENNMTYCKEEGKTFEETYNDMFSFITKESEIKELKEVYDEIEVEVED
jgi:hypothetical protein